MKKLVFLIVIMMGFGLISVPLSSQNKIDEGFIINVEDVTDFFVQKDDDVMMIERFYLENFPEGKSSKPLHEKINQMDGVVKFGIASGSEEYNNQRRCYLTLQKANYTDSFKKVLTAIPVKYIVENGEQLSIEECIEKINRKR